MGSVGLRIAVAGATGALGGCLIEALIERSFPVRELVPIATKHSIGEDVEIGGEIVPVLDGPPADLAGIDLMFLCAPAVASEELARLALRQSVPIIDLSGAFAMMPQVPLEVAACGLSDEACQAPLVATPSGGGIAWSMLLHGLNAEAGVKRAVGTVLSSVSSSGRPGMERLSEETVAIFNQGDLPESEVFQEPLAFDCRPGIGGFDEDSENSLYEGKIMRDVCRVLDRDIPIMVTAVRVPTFLGEGIALEVELGQPLGPSAAALALAKVSGIEIWDGDEAGPSTRCSGGEDFVLVSRLRADTANPNVIHLWAVADPLRVAALNALKIAEARLKTEA